ncbi:MAG: hypothetical protein EP343_30820 [Deltaproteobacteria bacterium]|nr:MAG: hypothetical protein EP343_30820 [Deltaproteobacteria bacterium]
MELQTEEEPNKETFAPSILALDIEEITEKSEPKEKGTGKVKWVSQISTKALFEAGAQVDGLSSQADGMLRLDSKPPLENERAGTPEDEQMTSPEVYNDEEEHCFYIGLWRQIEEKETDTEKDAEELDETEEENPWQEIDLSRHQHSPFHFIRRELEHYFRGTRIENWNLSDFVIEGSDSFETKQARPVFTNVSMQGSTLKGGILNSVVVDGFFEATSACAFDGCEWKGCEFRGPVRLYRSEIPNTLTFLGCSFADNVELAWMRCYGQVRFLRCNLKGTLNLRENRVSYLWNFEDTEFTGPVTIEREQGSGGLRLFECEFTKTFQIRKSDWNGNLDLSRSFFGDEVLLKVVKFPTLNENRLQQTATGMEIIRATDQTGKINLTGSFFSKLCSFKDVEAKSITASDEKHLTQFKGDVEFRNVALTHHMFCGHARFAGPLTLEDVSAPDFVSFLGCEFSQNVLVQRMQNEPSLSFIRSSFAERLLLEDPNGLRNIFVGRTTCHGPVIVRGTLTPQDDLPIESLEQNSLYSITFSETQCTEPVTLENLSVESTIDFRKTLFTKDLTIQNVIFHGEIHATGRLRRHKICGQIRLEEVEVHNLLSLRELHRCTVMLDNAHVRDELDIRSFSKKRPLHCSLSEASITTITFPNDPIDSIGFALPLPEEVEDPKQLPMLCQQKAQHYSQLYQLSLQRKQYEEAKEFRYHYRKALKGLSFVQRYKYLRDMREFEDHGSNTKTSHPHKSQSATLHRLAGSAHTEKLPVRKRSGWIQTFAALWESLIIQFGHTYDGYGKSPLKVLMWLLAFNSLCVFHGLFGWGFEKIGVVWLDTLLTPIGFLFQGVGLRPFGSRFPSMPQQIAFYTHTILVGLMWLYFLRLLIPGLVGRDKISQMLSKRTGSV